MKDTIKDFGSLALVLVILGGMIQCSLVNERKNDIKRCERDAMLFNRTTQMIDGECYVAMDDGRWLPQMIYWFDYYAK